MKTERLVIDLMPDVLDALGRASLKSPYFRSGFIKRTLLEGAVKFCTDNGDKELASELAMAALALRLNERQDYARKGPPQAVPTVVAILNGGPTPFKPGDGEPMMDYSSMEDPPKQSPWIDRCKKWAGKEDAFRIILEDMQAELTNSSDGALLRMLDERAPDVIERSYKQFWWKENPALAISTVLYEMIKPVRTPEENAQSVSDLEAEYQRRIQAK
jgi:hypothetical protein